MLLILLDLFENDVQVFFFVSKDMKKAESYLLGVGVTRIDVTLCNFVPDAPRITMMSKSNSDVQSSSEAGGNASDTKRKHSNERKPATVLLILRLDSVPLIFQL